MPTDDFRSLRENIALYTVCKMLLSLSDYCHIVKYTTSVCVTHFYGCSLLYRSCSLVKCCIGLTRCALKL